MPKKRRDERTTVQRAKAFLRAYAETYNVVAAAKKAGIARSRHYHWLAAYPWYVEVFEKAKRAAADYLEAECIDRATKGWMEPIFYQGTQCGEVRRFDSGMAQMLLRGIMPEKYGYKTEISGPQGAPVQAKIEVVFVRPDDPQGSHDS
jgi:hypothetical protein